ncbi:trehalose-6-phosphate synthase [Candidatus Daviesbacteria bacterium]|nr:trehalose-6-phosphate synthase [Candidatus Daviesbacteria bacterium]
MRQLFIAVFAIIVIITLVVVVFTADQAYREEQRLHSDLKQRSTLLSESLKESIEPNFINKPDQQLQYLVNKFEAEERLVGMNIYDNKANPTATSSSLTANIPQVKQIAADAMDQDQNAEDFIQLGGRKIYLLATPLHNENSVVGALMIAQNAGYIDTRLEEIWKNNLVRFFIQSSLLSVASLLLIYWVIYKPVRNLQELLRSARTGNPQKNLQNVSSLFFFKPLVKEVTSVGKSLIEARSAASEEARLRMEQLDSPWTAHRLKEYSKDILGSRPIIVVSNREPFIHTKNGNINYYVPASGMVTAIEPLINACGGTWIAHGSGNADKLVVDSEDKIKVPPDDPKYTLKRVWLTEQEEKGYYLGFSNGGLWPLCHIAHVRPVFKKEDWEEYKKVNDKFTQAILSEIKNQEKPVIFIQDFHLSLVPKMIKQTRPDATVSIFWHTPWPNEEIFSVCPWKKEILDGILGADLVGFHTLAYCHNFVDSVSKELESLIDVEQFSITRNNHTSHIKPFPISIPFPNGPQSKDDGKILQGLNIKTKFVGVGVDRLDYTKGLLEKIKGIEIFLKNYPQYQGNFTFIQLAVPSKSKIPAYEQFVKEVDREVDRVNSLFKKNKPIIWLKKHHTQEEIYKFYKVAQFCLVTSLHDGMNLVSKEFVAARDDKKGVLILSQFTGAAKELKDAIIINPYDAVETANAIKTALEMPVMEQVKRMSSLREMVKGYNIYRWFAEILKTMTLLG